VADKYSTATIALYYKNWRNFLSEVRRKQMGWTRSIFPVIRMKLICGLWRKAVVKIGV